MSKAVCGEFELSAKQFFSGLRALQEKALEESASFLGENQRDYGPNDGQPSQYQVAAALLRMAANSL